MFNMNGICCIGHITHDRIITPSAAVDMAGGTSFYFAHALARLPKTVDFRLVTKGGEDIRPEVERLRNLGVDVLSYPCRNTVFFENRYGADSNNRTQRVLAKADPFTVEETADLDAAIYHLGSLLADDFPPEVVEQLAEKGRVSIDVQGYLREVRGTEVFATGWRGKEKILACTDILKLNEHEMEVIASSRDARSVARELAASGVREVVITLGSYGSLIYADGKFYEIPAYAPRRVVDATGCGDTYSAGYLYMRAQGAGCSEAGRFAAAMCTLKLEHSGPFEGSADDIKRLMQR